MVTISRASCSLVAIALFFSMLFACATAQCPEIEDHMSSCAFNRTELMTELYTTLALTEDSVECVSAGRLADAYRILVPGWYKQRFGDEYDDHIFDQCDYSSDGQFCAIDVQETVCTCVVVCDSLRVVKTMSAAAQNYPNWLTEGVPWNQ